MMALSLQCVHCQVSFEDPVPILGETPMASFQRMFPACEDHLKLQHPQIYEQCSVTLGVFAGYLSHGQFKVDDAEVQRFRLQAAAALHQWSKRGLTDADIKRIVETQSTGGQLPKQKVVELLKQMRDYLDYSDVLQAEQQPKKGTAA